MTAPPELIEVTRRTAQALATAAEAEAFGEHDRHVEAIDEAAELLLDVFAPLPHEVPPIVATLAALAPAVRPSDLAAACAVAQDAYSTASEGDYSIVLHPECRRWVTEAALEHDADEAVVVALLCCELRIGEPPHRRARLPVPDGLRSLVGGARWADLEAAASVSAKCAAALEAEAQATSDLLALVEPRLAHHDTVLAAVDALDGSDRLLAEDLLARLPSVLVLPGEVPS